MLQAVLTGLVKSEAGKSLPATGRDNEGPPAAEMWQRPSRYREVIKYQAGEEGGGIILPWGRKQARNNMGKMLGTTGIHYRVAREVNSGSRSVASAWQLSWLQRLTAEPWLRSKSFTSPAPTGD